MSLFLSLRSLALNGFERNNTKHRNKKKYMAYTHVCMHESNLHSRTHTESIYSIIFICRSCISFWIFPVHSIFLRTHSHTIPSHIIQKASGEWFNKQRSILISAPLYLQQQQQQNGKWSNIHPFNNVSLTYTFIMCCVLSVCMQTHMKYMYTSTVKYKHAASSISCETLRIFLFIEVFTNNSGTRQLFLTFERKSEREICVWYAYEILLLSFYTQSIAAVAGAIAAVQSNVTLVRFSMSYLQFSRDSMISIHWVYYIFLGNDFKTNATGL